MADPILSLSLEAQQQEDETFLTSPTPTADVAPQEPAPLADKPQDEAPVYTGIDYAEKEAKRRKEIDVMARIGPDLKGETPELKPYQKQANALIDTKSAMDMTVNWRGTAAFMGMDVSELETSRYGEYKATIAGALNRPVPKSEGEYRSMLTEHFTREKGIDDAFDSIQHKAVMDSWQDNSKGMSAPITQRYSEFSAEHADALKGIPESQKLAEFSRQYAGVRSMFASANAPLAKELVDRLQTMNPEADVAERGKQFMSGNAGEVVKSFTSGPTADPSTQSDLIDKLANLSPKERQDVYAMAGAYSKANTQGQAGYIPELYNLAKTFTRAAEGFAGNMSTSLQERINRDSIDLPLSKTRAEVTPEERAAADKREKYLRVASELSEAAKNQINPLPGSAGLNGAIETVGRSLVGMAPIVATTLMQPEIGVPLLYASITADTQQRLLNANPNLSVRDAGITSQIEALPQTALMYAGVGLAAKSFPAVEGILTDIATNPSIKAKILNAAIHSGGGSAAMFASGVSQAVGDKIANAINSDIDAGPELSKQLATLAAEVPTNFVSFMILGYAMSHANSGELKQAIDEAGSTYKLRILGFNEEQAQRIATADPNTRLSILRKETPNRTEESIKAGAELARSQKQVSLDAVQDTESPNHTILDDGTHVFTIPDGKGGQREISRTKDTQDAAAIHEQLWKMHDAEQIKDLNDTLSLQEQADKEQGIDGTRTTDVSLKKVTFQDMHDAGMPMEKLKASMRVAGINEDRSLSDVFVDGLTEGELKDGIYTDTIKINNLSPRTAIHERLDASTKRVVQSGKIPLEQFASWVRQTEQATGQTYMKGKEVTPQAITEAVTSIGEEYIAGQADVLRGTASPLAGFYKSLVRYFNNILGRSKVLRESFKSGKIDSSFEQHLARSIGLPISERLAPREATAKAELMGERVAVSDVPVDGGNATFSVRLKGDELGDANILGELKKNAKEYLRSLRGKSVEQKETGEMIRFDKRGEEKSVSGMRQKEELQVIAGIKDLIANSKYLGSRPDSTRNAGIKSWMYYESKAEINGIPHDYLIVVREAHDGQRFYETYTKKDGLDATKGGSIPSKEGTEYPPAPSPNDNVESSRNDVNTSFSISTREERERINQEIQDRIGNNPDARVKIYERMQKSLVRAQASMDEIKAAFGDQPLSWEDSSKLEARKMEQSLVEVNAIVSSLPPDIKSAITRNWRNPQVDALKALRQDAMDAADTKKVAELDAKIEEARKRGEAGNIYTKYTSLKSDKARADFLIKTIDRANDLIDRSLAGEYREKIEATLKKAKPTKSEGGIKKSKYDAATQEYADMAYKASLLNEQDTIAKLDALEKSIADAQTPEEEAALVDEWAITNQYGNLAKQDHRKLGQTLNELDEAIAGGREARRIAEQARVDDLKAKQAQILENSSGWTDTGLDKAEKNKNDILSLGDQLIWSHASYESVLRRILPSGLEGMVQDWSNRIRRANNATEKAALTSWEGLIKSVQDGMGGKGFFKTAEAMSELQKEVSGKVKKIMGRKTEEVYITIDKAEAILRGEANPGDLTKAERESMADELAALPLNSKKKGVTITRTVEEGKEADMPMSLNQMIFATMAWEQKDVREKMASSGWTQESYDQMKAEIANSKVASAVLDHLKDFYKGTANTINPVHTRMYGMRLPDNPNYAPTSYWTKQNGNDIALGGMNAASASTTPGLLKARVKHGEAFKLEDATEIYQSRAMQIAQWTSFAELHREINAVLNDKNVRLTMTQANGVRMQELAARMIDTLGKGGGVNTDPAYVKKWLGAAVGGTAVSAMGFNLKSIVNQFDASTRFLYAMPFKDVIKSLADPAGVMASMPAAWNSDAVQNRIKAGSNPAMRFVLKQSGMTTSKFVAGIHEIAAVSLKPMMYADGYLTTLSSAIVYRDAHAKALESGLSPKDAEARALDAMDAAIWRFSQPVMFSAKSDVENTSNAATKLLYLFASDARLRTGIIIDAVSGIRSGKGDKAEHMKKIGVVLAAAVLAQTISNAYRDIFSDDTDSEIWTWGGYGKAVALAPFAGYFLIGTALDVALGHMTGQKVYNSSSNPVVNAEQNVYNAAKHAPDAFQTQDTEKLLKELGRISKAVSVTPAMSVPGAIYNPIKTAIGAKKNIDRGED